MAAVVDRTMGSTDLWGVDSRGQDGTITVTFTSLAPSVGKLSKEEIKAINREQQREQSLQACAWLMWAHHCEVPAANCDVATVHRRTPTQRRTATGARNHRC